MCGSMVDNDDQLMLILEILHTEFQLLLNAVAQCFLCTSNTEV